MSQILNIGRSLQSDYWEWLSACTESGLEAYAGALVTSHHAMTAPLQEDIAHILATEYHLGNFFASAFLPDPSEALDLSTATYPEQQKTEARNQSRPASIPPDSSGWKGGAEIPLPEKQPPSTKQGEAQHETPRNATTPHDASLVPGSKQTPALLRDNFENNRFSPEIQSPRSKQDEEYGETGSGPTTGQQPPVATNQLAVQSPNHLEPNGFFSNNDWGGETTGKQTPADAGSGTQKTAQETVAPKTVAKGTGVLPQNEPSDFFPPSKPEEDFVPLKRLPRFNDWNRETTGTQTPTDAISDTQNTVQETPSPKIVAKGTGVLPQTEPNNVFLPQLTTQDARSEDDFVPLKRLSHFSDWNRETTGTQTQADAVSDTQKTVQETVAKETGILPQNEPSDVFLPFKTEGDFVPLKRLSHFADHFSGWVSTDPLPVLNTAPADLQSDAHFISTGPLSTSKAIYPESPTDRAPREAQPSKPKMDTEEIFRPSSQAHPFVPETELQTIESQYLENHAVPNPDLEDLMELFAHRMEQAFHRFYG